ncbi:MAG: Rid family detoxifying hydrolase [Burkholderiales bacterium]|nr:Rid family detoxifying hydrolase [Burkholderiales bacterium]
MMKQIIHTDNAPQAIGCYSQAVKVGNTVYLSGQIGLEPATMVLADGIYNQAQQMFRNLAAVAIASGGSLDSIVKLTIYLTDMNNFQVINQIMAELFNKPYPARAAIGVRELPKGALVEAEAILVI